MFYFVSRANGSDSYTGSLEAPFKTVAKAIQAATTGDTIYLRGDTYPERVVLSKSITLTAFKTDKGTEEVTIIPNAGQDGDAVLITGNNSTLSDVHVNGINRVKVIAILAHDVAVKRCEVFNGYGKVTGQYGHGIIVSDTPACYNIALDDNTIHHVGAFETANDGFCHAVYSACPGMRIRGGEVHTIGGHAVHWYASQGGDLIVHGMNIHDTRVGIGLYQSTSLAYNNIIQRTVQSFVVRYGALICLVSNNTCLNNGIGIDIAELSDTANLDVANNIFDTGTFAVHAENSVPTLAKVAIHDNIRANQLLPDAKVTYFSTLQYSHIEYPFTPYTADFRPLAGNVAIQRAQAYMQVTTDRDGNPRRYPPSIGAYELYTPVDTSITYPTIQPRSRRFI